MSASLPARPHFEQVESSYSREEVVAAIRDFYELLIKLPYIDPSALVFPPPEGWFGVNAGELRARGKTEEVIELLRRLPYLRAPAPGKKWMIGPDTVEIAYCDGELYEKVTEFIQPVPGHCIWLSDSESRDGTSLLLDTQTGTITEWTTLGHKIMIDDEEYENMLKQDKWMAHATMPVTAFFRLQKRKFEKLVWMALYNPRGPAGTAQWYIATTTQQEEEDMLASDDDFEPDGDEHGDVDESGSGSDGKDDVNNVDVQISNEEVDGLMEDAYGDEAHQKRMDLQPQENASHYTQANPLLPEPEDQRRAYMKSLDRKTKEVYEIYTRYGWMSNFNRERCRIELAKFLEREEGPVNPPQVPFSDQDAMLMRQRMIEEHEKRRHKGWG